MSDTNYLPAAIAGGIGLYCATIYAEPRNKDKCIKLLGVGILGSLMLAAAVPAGSAGAVFNGAMVLIVGGGAVSLSIRSMLAKLGMSEKDIQDSNMIQMTQEEFLKLQQSGQITQTIPASRPNPNFVIISQEDYAKLQRGKQTPQ